jgi:hypothetical protein
MDRKHAVLGAAAVVSATALLVVVFHRRRKAKKAAASNKLVSSRGERLNLPGHKSQNTTQTFLSLAQRFFYQLESNPSQNVSLMPHLQIFCSAFTHLPLFLISSMFTCSS